MTAWLDPLRILSLQAAWCVALAVLAWALWPPPEHRSLHGWAGAAALLLLAAVPRWLAPWSTFDSPVRATALPSLHGYMDRYGHGMPALELLLRDVLGVPRAFEPLFALGFVAGVLTPLLLVRCLGAWGLPPLAAWTAGIVLALDPAHVRLSPTELPQIHEILLTLVALLAVARHGVRPGLLPALGAACALGVATALRPEGLVLPAVVAALVAVAPHRPPLWSRGTLVGVAVLGGLVGLHGLAVVERAGAAAFTDGLFRGGAPDHALLRVGWRHVYWLDPAWTAPLLGLTVALGATARPRRQLRTLAAVAVGLTLLVPGAWWTPVGAEAPAYVRHQLRAAPWVAALAGVGVARVGALVGPGAGLVSGLALLGARLAWLPIAYVPSTVQEEFRFVLAHAATVPPGCTLVVPVHGRDGPLQADAVTARLRPRAPQILPDAPDPGGCLVWYRSGACSVLDFARGQPAPTVEACARFEATHTLSPRVTATLPARSWIGEAYLSDTVEVGFYDVVRSGPRAEGPSAPPTPPPPGRPATPPR